jgi:hypothetical protein
MLVLAPATVVMLEFAPATVLMFALLPATVFTLAMLVPTVSTLAILTATVLISDTGSNKSEPTAFTFVKAELTAVTLAMFEFKFVNVALSAVDSHVFSKYVLFTASLALTGLARFLIILGICVVLVVCI